MSLNLQMGEIKVKLCIQISLKVNTNVSVWETFEKVIKEHKFGTS